MENLGIDIKLLIAQLINFILFFYIFKKFISKPFNKFLGEEKRKEELKEKLDSSIKETEEKRIVDDKLFKQKLEKERNNVIKQAREQGEKIKTEMIKETEEEIVRLKTKTKQELEKSKLLMERNLKKEIVSLSINIVETGLKNYLSPQISKELTQEILKNSTKIN